MLGWEVRLELRDAKGEHEWRLEAYRALGCRLNNSCEPDVEEQVLQELADAKHELCALVWTCTQGRGATAREVAEVLGVELRTVERYKAEFRAGLAKHQKSTVE